MIATKIMEERKTLLIPNQPISGSKTLAVFSAEDSLFILHSELSMLSLSFPGTSIV